MNVQYLRSFLRELSTRRKELKMPLDALAHRSGLSRATVCRLLKGDQTNATFLNVAALAKALGVKLTFRQIGVEDFVKRQARRQARKLVGMAQGTMGLESQAIDAGRISRLVKETRRELLAGPRKRLWYD